MSEPPEGSSTAGLDAARRRLVESVSGTVAAIAFTLAAEVGERWLDDLKSAGYVGACEAALAYREDAKTSFEGFAWKRIAGAMIDFLRRERVKLPPALAAALDKAAAAFEAAADYVDEVRDKGEDSLDEETDGAGAVVAVGLLCMGAGARDPETVALQEEGRAHLRRALSLLSERDRTLLALRWFEGLTFKELAGHFGTHVDTARARHHAGMKKLGAILRPILLPP